MQLQRLILSQFRCFSKKSFEFDSKMTVVCAPNAYGKTSLLEGIFTAIYGKGFRESREMELLRWDHDQSLIGIDIEEKKNIMQLSLLIQKKTEKTVAKQYSLNRSKVTHRAYRSHGIHAVLFAPQHINIITGSPTRRRDYIDSILSARQIDYAKKLRNYHNALRRRNKILEIWQDEAHLMQELNYWNQYLCEHSSYIISARTTYVHFLNQHQSIDGKNYKIEYIANPFDEKSLARVRSAEIRIRHSMIGPQKDEFRCYIVTDRDIDVQLYGSRSQQRMAVFWLKLNELHYFEEESGNKPLLLLDDIFSELDETNRELALQMVQNYQTVITTTEEEINNILPMKNAKFIKL